MYYPDDEWIPLRDLENIIGKQWQEVTKVNAQVPLDEVTSERRKRKQDPERERAQERDKEIVSMIWRVCDACQAATLTKKGKLIFVSKSLFTRRSNGSVYGDFVKLDLGQIGSGEWFSSQDELADDHRKTATPPHELEMLLYPFYQHHILIRRADLEAFLSKVKEAKQAAAAEKRKPGRPPQRYEFLEYYNDKYPEGHAGTSIAEVIRVVHEAGGPLISPSTFHDIIKATKNKNAKSPE